MRGSLFLTMHKTQFAFWTCIGWFIVGLFARTNLHSQPGASPSPMEHIPQSEYFPHAPTPSISPVSSGTSPSPHSISPASLDHSPIEEAPKQIDLSQFPATAVEEVVVPL